MELTLPSAAWISESVLTWAHAFGAIALPSPCFLCREPLLQPLKGPVCCGCRLRLAGTEGPECIRCGMPQSKQTDRCFVCCGRSWSFGRARSLGGYRGLLEAMIVGLKFMGKPGLAAPLGTLLARRVWSGASSQASAIVPVPLSGRRRRQRGFNQAELIAQHLATRLALPVRPNWLKRVRHTMPQAELSARERRHNLRGAFRGHIPATEVGKPLLLVDDVFTTGTTVSTCAKSLLAAGASRVDVLTVARVL